MSKRCLGYIRRSLRECATQFSPEKALWLLRADNPWHATKMIRYKPTLAWWVETVAARIVHALNTVADRAGIKVG